LHSFIGPSISEKISQAAHSIGAHILSPSAQTNEEWFTSNKMISEAHRLGIEVKPWTVNNLSVVEELVEWGVDGIITDCKSFSVVRVDAPHRVFPNDRSCGCETVGERGWRDQSCS
jgi:hypothetical protein